MAFDNQLPKKSDNLSEWYNKVVLDAGLADYGPAKGTMIFRPYGYAIWELIQDYLNGKIKAAGVKNAYFPLFIPESLIKKEASHIEGFSPELAVVTIGGGEELAEKLIVRPTSETIMYDAYARWIQSYRDLPIKLNQWNNVVRWEKRTYLFMRTSEFLWQEGHTAHATHTEASKTVDWAIKLYEKTYQELFAIPGFVGTKSESERFAGADETWTYEAIMPEGKALQSATSHDLGQNFSKTFDITFQDHDGSQQHVWQTSWGFSTRSLGALVLVHGDDKGLRLPPLLAPVQAIVIPVRDEPAILEYSNQVCTQLTKLGIRSEVESREGESFGFKIHKWELMGAPLRLEIGSKEVDASSVMVARRDTGEKVSLPLDQLEDKIAQLLDDIQTSLYHQAQESLKVNTHNVSDYTEFKQIMGAEKGFLRAPWCEEAACEAKIKADTTATTRCLEPAEELLTDTRCINCDKPAKHSWLFAQSY